MRRGYDWKIKEQSGLRPHQTKEDVRHRLSDGEWMKRANRLGGGNQPMMDPEEDKQQLI